MIRLFSRHSSRHRSQIETIERRFHPTAIGEHAAAPGLVGRVIEIRAHHLGQRHGAVADGFQQLIDDRDRRGIERRLAGPIENEAPARAREQAEDHGVLAQDISFEHPGGVAVQLEHPGIERQHVVGGSLRRGRVGTAGNRRHERRHILGLRRRAQRRQRDGSHSHTDVIQHRVKLHGLPLWKCGRSLANTRTRHAARPTSSPRWFS